MLTWSDQFATGFALVDTQHRMLIQKINLLEQLLNEPAPSRAICDNLVNFLGSYVATHFKYEEGCMARARCPVHAKNQQAHAAFLAVFAKFKERYQVEGPKPELLRQLQTVSAEWIRNHILTVDTELKGCAQN